MAVTTFLYANGIVIAYNNSTALDWDGDTQKVLLTSACYTPNQDTHRDYCDVTNQLACGSGYTTGGDTVCTGDVTSSLNVVLVDIGPAQWTTASFTTRRAVLYDSTPACTANDILWQWVDFGCNQTVTSGTFTITPDCCPDAWFTVTAANAAGFP